MKKFSTKFESEVLKVLRHDIERYSIRDFHPGQVKDNPVVSLHYVLCVLGLMYTFPTEFHHYFPEYRVLKSTLTPYKLIKNGSIDKEALYFVESSKSLNQQDSARWISDPRSFAPAARFWVIRAIIITEYYLKSKDEWLKESSEGKVAHERFSDKIMPFVKVTKDAEHFSNVSTPFKDLFPEVWDSDYSSPDMIVNSGFSNFSASDSQEDLGPEGEQARGHCFNFRPFMKPRESIWYEPGDLGDTLLLQVYDTYLLLVTTSWNEADLRPDSTPSKLLKEGGAALVWGTHLTRN